MRTLTLAVLMTLAVAQAEASPGDLTFVEVRRIPLPGALARGCDVRFDGPEALVFTARDFGVARASFDARGLGPLSKLLSEGGTEGVMLAEHLALSPEFLAVASPINQLLWQSRRATKSGGQLGEWGDPEHAPISFFEDIDLRGDQLAILGLMRSGHGMSPDGAIAWTGRLGSKAVQLRPTTFSVAGKGASPENACAGTSVGKIRFLADGRLVVLPGAEPGIFVYSVDGKLQQTVDTLTLGLDLKCDFDEATRLRLGRDVRERLAYLNRFTTVDDILPLDEGPAVLMRSTGEFGTRWRVAVVDREGGARSIALPVTSTSVHAHLRGDALGARVVLVMREFLPERTHMAELIEYRLEVEAALPKPSPASRVEVH